MKTQPAHPQMALTAEMRTEGGWLSWRPLTVACRNCWMSSGDMAVVKRLAAHSARPRRNGDAAGQKKTRVWCHSVRRLNVVMRSCASLSWMSAEDSPAKLRSARTTPARKPCMSNWIRPFFTFSVMMVLTEPRANMQASWIFHLVRRKKKKNIAFLIQQTQDCRVEATAGWPCSSCSLYGTYVLREERGSAEFKTNRRWHVFVMMSSRLLTSARCHRFWPAPPPGGAWSRLLPALLRSRSETLQQRPARRGHGSPTYTHSQTLAWSNQCKVLYCGNLWPPALLSMIQHCIKRIPVYE